MPEEEQIPTEEKRKPIPGVDNVVTKESLEAVDLDKALEGVVGIEDVYQRLMELEKKLPEEQRPAIRLLAELAHCHFFPDCPTEPFRPYFLLVSDGRLEGWSFTPSELLDEQIEVIAAFAPTVTHLGLRARLCDVSWFRRRRRRDMAELAIAAYCDMVEAVHSGEATFSYKNRSAWGIEAEKALRRACRIFRAVDGWELPPSKRLRSLTAELVSSAHKEGRNDDFGRIAGLAFDYKIIDAADLAAMAEGLAENPCLADNPDARIDLWKLASRAYRRTHDEDKAGRCMISVAECLVQKADLSKGEPFSEATFLWEAISTLRNLPNTKERREQLNDRLLRVQRSAAKEMMPLSVPIDLKEISKRSVAEVSGRSFPSAFSSLALCDQPPTPDEIRRIADNHTKEHTFWRIPIFTKYDLQGLVVFKTSGMGTNEAEQKEYSKFLMAFHRDLHRQLTVAGKINSMRCVIASEHALCDETILELLHESPFIPPGHEAIFARAIRCFLSGEYFEAITILTLQLENSLRHILTLNGHNTATADENGIQTEASLSILLNPDKPWRVFLEKIIHPRYIHEIDLLFNFAGGPAVRNHIAHGKTPTLMHWDHNFIYAAWLIIHLAVLPVAHRWEGVEEKNRKPSASSKSPDSSENHQEP